MYATCLDNRRIGASVAKSSFLSAISNTSNSHNKHASKQSSKEKYDMHDMQHTLRHMICMMCNYLGQHGQHKIIQLAKSRSSKTNMIPITQKIFSQYQLILSEITKDLENFQSERQKQEERKQKIEEFSWSSRIFFHAIIFLV